MCYMLAVGKENNLVRLLGEMDQLREQAEQMVDQMVERSRFALDLLQDASRHAVQVAQQCGLNMKSIAVIQTDIQTKLKKGMEIIKKWKQGHNSYFDHLDVIDSLPMTYLYFLMDIVRRANYRIAFDNIVRQSTHVITGNLFSIYMFSHYNSFGQF